MLDIFNEFPLSSETPRGRSDELIAAYDKLHKDNPLALQSRRDLKIQALDSEAPRGRSDGLIAAYDRLLKENPIAELSDRNLKNQQALAQELADAGQRIWEVHDQQAAQLEAQRDRERAAIAQSIEMAVNSRSDRDLAKITSLLKPPDNPMSRAVLIEKHRQAWPSIESDLNHTGTNGLSECKFKDPVTGQPVRDQWLEASCLNWAKRKGKYNEAGANLQPFPFARTSKRIICE